MEQDTRASSDARPAPDAPSSWAVLGAAVFTWASLATSVESPALSGADAVWLVAIGAELRPGIDALLAQARETEAGAFFDRPLAPEDAPLAMRLLRRRVQGVLGPLAMKLSAHAKEHPAVREYIQEVLATAVGVPIQPQPASALPALPADVGEPLPPSAEPHLYAPVPPVDRPIASATEVREQETHARDLLSLELERIRRDLAGRFPDRPDFVASFFVTPKALSGLALS